MYRILCDFFLLQYILQSHRLVHITVGPSFSLLHIVQLYKIPLHKIHHYFAIPFLLRTYELFSVFHLFTTHDISIKGICICRFVPRYSDFLLSIQIVPFQLFVNSHQLTYLFITSTPRIWAKSQNCFVSFASVSLQPNSAWHVKDLQLLNDIET